jgi:hypothetical protein
MPLSVKALGLHLALYFHTRGVICLSCFLVLELALSSFWQRGGAVEHKSVASAAAINDRGLAAGQNLWLRSQDSGLRRIGALVCLQ